MNDFLEIAASLAAARDRLRELVTDEFGGAVAAEVFEPLLSEAHGLAALDDEAGAAARAADRLLEEARALGGLDGP